MEIPEPSAFCDRVSGRLVGALTLYCGDRHVAEELAQEALARAWGRWATVGRTDSPEAWTFRAALDLADSRVPRRRAERRVRAALGPSAPARPRPAGEQAAVVADWFYGYSVGEAGFDALSEAAGPERAAFTADDVRGRVAERRAARRRRAVAGIALLAAVAALGAAAGRSADWGRPGDSDSDADSGGDDDDGDDIDMESVSPLGDRMVGAWDLSQVSLDTGLGQAMRLELGADGTVHGDSGCNTFSASGWSVDGDALVLDDFSRTTAECPGPPGEVEDLFFELVQRRPSITHHRREEAAGLWTSLRLWKRDGSFVVFERDPKTAGYPAIGAGLPDGRRWVVVDSGERGFCVRLGDTDLGCDDTRGPTGRPGEPGVRAEGLETSALDPGPTLVFGKLPPGAVAVDLAYADGRKADPSHLLLDLDKRLWAYPSGWEDHPTHVTYLDAAGHPVDTFDLPVW